MKIIDLNKLAEATYALNDAIMEVCPIDGISIGDPIDKSTWKIQFKDEATQLEIDAANSIISAADIIEA